MDKIVIYPYVKPIVATINRKERRLADAEYQMIVKKLSKIAEYYESEITTRNSHDCLATFHHYNTTFQNTADYLSSKIKYHAIHRGWFFTMYKFEEIGVKRAEERNTNCFSNWTIETLATPLLW